MSSTPGSPPADAAAAAPRAAPPAAAPAAADPLIGRVLGERFQLDARLARGGMGVVYRGTDLHLTRACAVKVLSQPRDATDAAHRRFAREAAHAAEIRHPNVVEVYGTGAEPELGWLAMELVTGPTLLALVERTGPLEATLAARYIEPLSSALAAAHALGIVHRDLKPSNVVIDHHAGGDRPVLLDFGISRTVDTAADTITTVGTVMGTPAFMAPEQREGREPDVRSDVFALGVLAAWMLAGRIPVSAWGRALTAEMFGPVQPWSEAVDAVLRAALEPEPEKRTSSVQQFAAAFVRAAGGVDHHTDLSGVAASREAMAANAGYLRVTDVQRVAPGTQEQVASNDQTERGSDGPTAPYQPTAHTLPPAPGGASSHERG